MISNQSSLKAKLIEYYITKPRNLLLIIFLSFFIFYTSIDIINTYVFQIYPIYHSVYAQGSADSIYFSNAVKSLLAFKLPSNNFDGGLLAILIYTIPVIFSRFTHLDIGLSFRLFYLLVLLITGLGLFQIGKNYYNDQIGFKLALCYVFNPLIFLLSVWAGSEEIIEACFIVFVIYFSVKKQYNYAILLALLSCFYKYYSILLLPVIILSMEDSKRRIQISAILLTIFSISGLFMIVFLNKYVMNIFNLFIASFHLQGKGVFNLLVEYANITQVNEIFGFLYYGLIALAIILFIWFTSKSDQPSKYSLIFLVFFILFPEFYSSYLIIPFIGVVLFYPKICSKLPLINFIALPILSFLSEFSFNLVDSPYPLLNIQPTTVLRLMGVLSLFGLYLLMILWLVVYIKQIKKEKSNEFTK